MQKSDHVPNVKSVGNSATAPRDLKDNGDVRLMLFLLAESVAARMRELAARCTVVEVSVRDADLFSFTRRRKLSSPSCSSAEIAETAFSLFCGSYPWEKPVRSVGVRGAELVDGSFGRQLSFYRDDIRRDRWERLDAAVDGLRQRYGTMSVRRALLLADPLLGGINPKDEHVVHPVGFFGR